MHSHYPCHLIADVPGCVEGPAERASDVMSLSVLTVKKYRPVSVFINTVYILNSDLEEVFLSSFFPMIDNLLDYL